MGIVHGAEGATGNKREQKAVEKQIGKEGHWSGAKTLEGGMSLEVGVPRIKSGRSDMPEQRRSPCMSCSDKILVWNCVGVQGSILGGLLSKPVFLEGVVIEMENKASSNEQAVKRGLLPGDRAAFLGSELKCFHSAARILLVD
jgi:hypothetical protein